MSLTKVSFSMIQGAPLNIVDYGADPTGASDSTAALQAAIVAAQAGYGYVYIPIGEFLITDRILVNPAVSIKGQDQDKSILKFDVALGTAASDSLIEIFNGTFFTVGNFCLDGNARGGTTNGYGMQIYFCQDFEVSDIKFYDVRKGNLGLTNQSGVSLCERVKILRNRIIPLSSAAQEGIGITGVEHCLIDGNIIDNPIDDSIALHGSLAVEFDKDPCQDVIISNNIVGHSIYLTPSPTGQGRLLLEGECLDVLITGNIFYGANTTAYKNIEFQNPITAPNTPYSEGYPKHISIVGNQFYCYLTGSSQPTGIIVGLGANISISDNMFTNLTIPVNITVQPSGYLQLTNTINVSGNTFTGNGSGTSLGIVFGSEDFPAQYPTIIRVSNNFFGSDFDYPVYFSKAIDGELGKYVLANNTQYGSAENRPPYYLTGTPKYIDMNNNSWNRLGAIPVSDTWARGSIQWVGFGATSGQNIGWVCTAAGAPGTWRTFGTIA
jgi:hypothetical protein